MEPWEVMISESQERMVAIVAPEQLGAGQATIDRWELHHAVIGEVTETGELRAFWHGDVVGAIPARHLTEDCPRYVVEQAPRAATAEIPFELPPVREALLGLLASPQLCSRAFVTERYDQLVQSRTVRRPGLDAAVLRLRPDGRGLAVTLDGQSRIGSARTRASAARLRSSRRRGTSPVSAGSPSASPTASTSEIPRSPRSAGSSPSRSRGWPRPARRWGCRSSRGTSRSTTTPTGARSTRLPSSAASGSSPTCAAFPSRWRDGRRRPPRPRDEPADVRGLRGAGAVRGDERRAPRSSSSPR